MAASVARDVLMRQFRDVQRGTRRLLELIPPERLDWAPHPGMFTLRQLAGHLATIGGQTASGIVLGVWERPHVPEELTRDQALERLEASVTRTEELLAQLSDAEFERREIQMPWGVTMTVARAVAALIEHDIHHRTQLFLYLRELGLEVTSHTLFG